MENSYTYGNLRLEKTEITILEKGLNIKRFLSTGVQKDESMYSFEQITGINLTPSIEKNQHWLKIDFANGDKIKLRSCSFSKATIGKKVEDQLPAFKKWVQALHYAITSKHPVNDIRFTTGGSILVYILSAFAFFILFVLVTAIIRGELAWALKVVLGLLFYSLIIYKIGFKKSYDPNLLPIQYRS
jgi:uncharacterized protein YacL